MMKTKIRSFISKAFAGVGICTILVSCGEGICNSGTSGKCINACPAVLAGDASIMSTALSTIATLEGAADSISNTLLTVPGDSYSQTSGGSFVRVDRFLTSQSGSTNLSIGTATANVSTPSTTFAGSAATTIDHDFFTYTPNILSDYYSPSATWHSSLVGYRFTDSTTSSAVAISSINQSGSPVALTLPCDTSTCTTQCTCLCYRWNFTTNRWTQSGMSTVQGGQTVSCSRHLAVA